MMKFYVSATGIKKLTISSSAAVTSGGGGGELPVGMKRKGSLPGRRRISHRTLLLPAVLVLGLLLSLLFFRITFIMLESAAFCSSSIGCLGWRGFGGSDSTLVVKTLQGLLPMLMTNQNDPQMMKELNQMEEEKTAIDKKAESLVRRELWCGLGYFVIQTAAFMRLTFWELSWDVMEPICFYVTSIYCMAGYTFFLRTSKEPSFEGFFQSRFVAKQKRLMKLRNFDLQRYNELRRVCYPRSSSPLGSTVTFNSSDNVHKTEFHNLHEHFAR